jgi:hypothetical protein
VAGDEQTWAAENTVLCCLAVSYICAPQW